MKLPASVASAEAIFTDSQRVADNNTVWWINRSGPVATLRSFDPATERSQLDTRFRPVAGPGDVAYDIGFWQPLRVPALFEIRQAPKRLYVTVRRSDTGVVVNSYSTPITAPGPGTHRSFEVANLTSPRSDLFILDRGLATTRVRLGILSGESGFNHQAFATYLPFRGLRPSRWSVSVGELAGKTLANGEPAPPRPDLLLVERDPDRKHANLKVISGEEAFEGFSYQRDIDEPGDLPVSRLFLQGAYRGAPSLFELIPDAAGGPELRIFDIQAPAGFL